MKKFILSGILSVLVVTGLVVTITSFAAAGGESANGHGTLNNMDGSKRLTWFN